MERNSEKTLALLAMGLGALVVVAATVLVALGKIDPEMWAKALEAAGWLGGAASGGYSLARGLKKLGSDREAME